MNDTPDDDFPERPTPTIGGAEPGQVDDDDELPIGMILLPDITKRRGWANRPVYRAKPDPAKPEPRPLGFRPR